MPGAWTTVTVKDGGGTNRTMRAWDESGTGAGPFSFASTIADLTGAGSVVIKAASTAAAATDESLVTNESPNSQISATTGVTSGAAVVSDANGTLQQYLRGLVKMYAAAIAGVAGAVFSKITDGTNTMAVKAASTAPVATDPAAVVGLSPNSVDFGTGTGGSHTLRMSVDTAQLAPLATAPTTMSSGFQAVDAPTDGTVGTRLGPLTETAPGTDTASSGLNGRLQRIAQNITTLIAATLKVTLQAATSGGVSRSRTLIPNNTTAVVVKSGAGQLYKIRATNNSGTIAYIKLYDATSAAAGSGTPVDTIMIPANSAGGAGIVDTTDLGVVHATGITFIVTTGIADTDTGVPAANAYVVTLYYK